jgi:hypothetical protein
MRWNLLYPNFIQEADEYSSEYMEKRQKGEKEWATTSLLRRKSSEEMSSPTSSTKETHQNHSPRPRKRPDENSLDPPPKITYVQPHTYGYNHTNSLDDEAIPTLCLEARFQSRMPWSSSAAIMAIAQKLIQALPPAPVSVVMSESTTWGWY